jgi:2-dehydropantoate 2-reductase
MDGEWNGHIVVQGAGLIGGYIGGRLASAGAQVTLLGRGTLLDPVKVHGMHITDLDGADLTVTSLATREDPAVLATADLVITTVKSNASENAGRELAERTRAGTPVLSFQNGVRNAEILQSAAPLCDIISGMVPYNVTQPNPAHWHRGTQGKLYAARHRVLIQMLPMFARAGLPIQLSDDMPGVLWAKLVINLNNAVNALSGLPLLAQLSNRDYRLVVAACIDEALAAIGHAQITPVQMTSVPPAKLAGIMRLPNILYKTIAMRTLKIDATARSSMAEDLAASKLTEIDAINGAVVALGTKFRSDTPVNAKIVALVHSAEQGGQATFSGKELRRAVGV